ncbi:DNA repair protein RadA [Glycine soja]
MTTRLLRTIFIAHKLHLRNPKCIFPPLLSRHSSTATNSSEAREPAKETTTTTTTTSWSMYGNVYDRPIAQRELNDHSDGDENPSSGRAAKSVAVVTKIKGKGKVKTQWVCCSCGHSTGKWWGQCPECEMVGTMNEFHESKLTDSKSRGGLEVSEDAVGLWLPQRPEDLRPVKLEEVNRGFNYQQWRIPLSGSFGNEVSTVLGGGLVPGSLTLVGGDPGIGKSTLLLQIAAMIANECSDYEGPPVVYVSGEESLQQIGIRADRLGIKSNIYLYSSTDIEDILTKTHGLSPRALVVDSIQTVYLKTIIGSAGGIMQVKECTAALMRFAKTTNISVFLIGHVTKSGDIAGPRVLEHIVDVVLYMEGEKYSPYRMLRAVKNRFGSTDELAVLEMSQSGLQVVSNASEMFLTQQHSDSNVLAGLAIAALCLTHCPVSSSLSNGINANKANIIKCVLIKQTGLHLQDNAVFLNVVSGMTVTETAGDLAIAAAICSSFLEFPIPEGTAFIGEIGLGGELRMMGIGSFRLIRSMGLIETMQPRVPRIEKRVNTLVKLGYRMCVVPKQAEKLLETEGLGKMKVVGCKDLKEVIKAVFSRNN